MSAQQPTQGNWPRLVGLGLALSRLVREAPREDALASCLLDGCRELAADTTPRLLLFDPEGLRVYSLPAEAGARPQSGADQESTRLQSDFLRPAPSLKAWLHSVRGGCDIELPGRACELLGEVPGAANPDLWPLQGRDGRLGILLLDAAKLPPEQAEALSQQAAICLENLRLHQALAREARTDGLTGALNYRALLADLEQECERAARHGRSCAVLMVDVDNLKEYNDRNGHLGGSQALREMAKLLQSACRSIDSVAKYGGDEFALILPETSRAGARQLASRILELVREHRFEGQDERRLTVSVGIAVAPEDAEEARELLRIADEHLYAAKASGRDRIGS